jgi:hypothetical protein
VGEYGFAENSDDTVTIDYIVSTMIHNSGKAAIDTLISAWNRRGLTRSYLKSG